MTLPAFESGRPVHALLLHSDPDEVLDVLRACAGLEWSVATTPDEVAPALERATPSVVFSIKHSGFPGEAHRLAALWPSVVWFHVGGSGRDHLAGIDTDRITVTSSAGVLAPFLAERAFAGLLALTTGTAEFVRRQTERAWAPTRFRPLAGRTLLVVGVGHVGAEIARRARAFDMTVLGIRASGRDHDSVDEMHPPEALRALLPRADVLSLNVRLDDSTRGLIGGRELEALPAGAVVMNSARGAVLDAKALIAALDRNVESAWLDVFEQEPLPASDPLWSHPRVLVSPHCADQTNDFPRRFAAHFADLWSSRP